MNVTRRTALGLAASASLLAGSGNALAGSAISQEHRSMEQLYKAALAEGGRVSSMPAVTHPASRMAPRRRSNRNFRV